MPSTNGILFFEFSHRLLDMSENPTFKELTNAYEYALKKIKECHESGPLGISLNLSDIGLTLVPPEIRNLKFLRTLDLSDNAITELPAEIGNLTVLESLYASTNLLNTIPSEISRLKKLTNLYLPDNRLITLPREVFQLQSLQNLSLNRNFLIELPPEIGQLKNLTTLWAGEIPGISLPPEIGQLEKLHMLDLAGNQLKTLPSQMVRLRRLKYLFCHGNPDLGIPINVLGPVIDDCKGFGPEAKLNAAPANEILDYYFSTRGAQGQALREVKVILVGRGEVGKSSMIDVLRGGKFIRNRKRTDGIAITPWLVKLKDGPAELMLWDFGGQEIMHGTHQFFLTHRSLYVVMVDGRHDRGRQDAEYWLKLVRAFGGDSPVLVVMNRQKAHPFNVDTELLSQKYDVELDHFFRTDCESPATIKAVQKVILAEAARMLAAEELFPAKCWDVKTRLAAMKKHGEDYLSDSDYQTICAEHGIIGEEEQQKLLRRLADLGTVVSFPEEVRMSALSVLNPEWATDGIYRVVTNEELREERQGLLRTSALRKLLPIKRWPKPLHINYLLELMRKFDLCFPVDDSGKTVLVPELLPEITPPLGDWDAAKCVVFLYDYPVLPHGVLPRFITRTHELSSGQNRWRTGVVLADDDAEARVQADYDKNTLTIWVRGGHADARRALLKVIRHHFDCIHVRIEGLKPRELVAVANHPEVLVDYRDLVLDDREGALTIRVTIKGDRVDIPIADLLNGVTSPKQREAMKRLEKSGRERGFETDIYIEHAIFDASQTMQTDSHNITIHGNVSNSQVGLALENCSNLIQQQTPSELRTLLTELEKDVHTLLLHLPPDKQAETTKDWEMTVKEATSATPSRKWYSLSSEGLLEASKYVKDLSGNIAGTLGNLGKLLWPS